MPLSGILVKALSIIYTTMIMLPLENHNLNFILELNRFFFRYASQVSIGDEVLFRDSIKIASAKVLTISNIMMQG